MLVIFTYNRETPTLPERCQLDPYSFHWVNWWSIIADPPKMVLANAFSHDKVPPPENLLLSMSWGDFPSIAPKSVSNLLVPQVPNDLIHSFAPQKNHGPPAKMIIAWGH